MNIYEFRMTPEGVRPARWIRIQAGSENRARKYLEEFAPQQVRALRDPPYCRIIERGTDADLAAHYGCVNL